MAVTTEQIKELRELTGAGVMDCRDALQKSNGDFEKAVEFLREKGLAKAAKRAERQATEGVLDLYSHGNGRVGVMVEVNCETDFVARSEEFRTFAHEIALQIAAGTPRYIRPEDIPAPEMEGLKQNFFNQAVAEGKPAQIAERVAQGKLDKFLDEVCLLRQRYIRDDEITIEQLLMQQIAKMGENIIIRRFVRWELGEHAEK